MTSSFHFPSAKGSIPIELHPNLTHFGEASSGESLVSVRYGFRPDSVDLSADMHMAKKDDNYVITAKAKSGKTESLAFQGPASESKDDEYVLVFNPQRQVFVLQPLAFTLRVNAVRGGVGPSKTPAISTPGNGTPVGTPVTMPTIVGRTGGKTTPRPSPSTTASKKLPAKNVEAVAVESDEDDDEDDDLLGALADELEHSLEEPDEVPLKAASGATAQLNTADDSDISDEDDLTNNAVQIVGASSSVARKTWSDSWTNSKASTPNTGGPISLRGFAKSSRDESEVSSSEEE